MVIIFIREKIQISLAYIFAMIGIVLIGAVIIGVFELVSDPLLTNLGGLVVTTSPILAVVSGINFAILNMLLKSSNYSNSLKKKSQIAFAIAIIPFGLFVALIGFLGF